MLTQFKKIINKEKLIHSNNTVLVAVSGGVDSMVLLDLLIQAKDEMNLELLVGHFNHGIRDEEADEDAKFVEQCAKQHNLQFFTEKVDVPDHAQKAKISQGRFFFASFLLDAQKK